ncbi:hypothetical protein LR48_Vigan10g241400 [Vigna angularis]|uniref:WDR11 first beta-propeller domain-containing protein n=1 Tax=Phaseolus angularis TaxID=3914 RepID=A0A0L9VNQ9_PHAAN|nr:hypothetical protein LR48_Vigan10g241400 [Vigna angularis]
MLPSPPNRNNFGSVDLSLHSLFAFPSGSSISIVDTRSMQLLTSFPIPPRLHSSLPLSPPSAGHPFLSTATFSPLSPPPTTSSSLSETGMAALCSLIFASSSSSSSSTPTLNKESKTCVGSRCAPIHTFSLLLTDHPLSPNSRIQLKERLRFPPICKLGSNNGSIGQNGGNTAKGTDMENDNRLFGNSGSSDASGSRIVDVGVVEEVCVGEDGEMEKELTRTVDEDEDARKKKTLVREEEKLGRLTQC